MTRSRTPSGKLTHNETVKLMRYMWTRRHRLVDSKDYFWKRCSTWIGNELGKSIGDPESLVEQLLQKRREDMMVEMRDPNRERKKKKQNMQAMLDRWLAFCKGLEYRMRGVWPLRIPSDSDNELHPVPVRGRLQPRTTSGHSSRKRKAVADTESMPSTAGAPRAKKQRVFPQVQVQDVIPVPKEYHHHHHHQQTAKKTKKVRFSE